MDNNEARELSREIAKSVLSDKNIFDILYKMSRVLSYLISEQDERQKLILMMSKLREELEGNSDRIGLVHQMRNMEEQTKQAKKWLMGILAALIVGIILEGTKFIISLNIKGL